jgi:hypothetical protein
VVNKDLWLRLPWAQVINDGVSIARAIELEDPNAGAQLIRRSRARTNDSAGDGTTTASVLTAGKTHQNPCEPSRAANPIPVKKGIDKTIASSRSSSRSALSRGETTATSSPLRDLLWKQRNTSGGHRWPPSRRVELPHADRPIQRLASTVQRRYQWVLPLVLSRVSVVGIRREPDCTG